MANNKDMAVEQHTMYPMDAKRLVKALIAMKRPVFLHGPPGIGKSDIIRSIGEETNREVVDIRLLLMTEVDVRGIPYFNSETHKMEWAPPAAIPLEKDSTAIIFLDEITQASPSVQAAALQLVLDRKIGDFHLPEGVSIVAAGNRASDKTGAKAVIKALANRFVHINLEHKFKDWQIWAFDNDIHPDVIAFLSQNEHLLNQFNPASPENSFATPRTWSYFVSPMLFSKDMPADLLTDAISGAVGAGSALAFASLREIISQLPTPEEICDGKVKSFAKKGDEVRTAAQFAITVSCNMHIRTLYKDYKADRMTAEEFYTKANNFYQFAFDNLEAEIFMMGFSTALRVHSLPFHPNRMPALKLFMDKHSKLFKSIQKYSSDG